jgi:DNA-binding SARP family transcriptional activator/TolB-like protein
MPFLRLLGGPSLCGNGSTLTGPATQRHRLALLALLACSRSRPQSRDKLVAWLWPERDVEHARNLLNQGVHALRRAIGEAGIISVQDELQLDPAAVACDVVAFEDAIAAGELERAIGLYTGPFLDGFHLPGASEFEHWADGERERLRRSYARSLESLAEAAEKRREWSSAVERWRGLVSEEPYNARVTLRLMRALDAAGDRAGALQQARVHTLLLQQEFDAGPDPDIVGLAELLRTELANGDNKLAVRPRDTASEGSAPTVGTSAPARVTADRFASTAALDALDRGPDPPPEPVPVSPNRKSALPESPRRRWVVSGIIGLLVLGAIGLLGRVVRGPGAPDLPVQPTAIAILPFAYRGDPKLSYLNEGMADLLSARVDGAAGLRSIDQRALLTFLHRQGGVADSHHGRLAAERFGAGFFVLGSMVEAGGRLQISATIYDERARARSSMAMVSKESEIFEVADSMARQILAGIQERPPALTAVAGQTTFSLPALKAYLEGERELRAARYAEAQDAFRRATELDTTFALAYYRMAIGMHDLPLALEALDHAPRRLEALDHALRHSGRLAEHHRWVLEAYAALLRGDHTMADQRAREIVAVRPDDPEGWLLLARVTLRKGHLLGRNRTDARGAFERALALGPEDAWAIWWLAAIAAWERRLSDFDSLTNRLLRLDAPCWCAGLARGQRAIMMGDTAREARFVAELRQQPDPWAQLGAGLVAWTTGDLSAARRLWRLIAEPSRSRGFRMDAHVTLAKLELTNGRWGAASTELKSLGVLDAGAALEHHAFYALTRFLQAPRSELLALRDSLQRWNPSSAREEGEGLIALHRSAHPYFRLYLLGMLSARLGEPSAALGYAAELGRADPSSPLGVFAVDQGQFVRAEVAWLAGRREEAFTLLDRARYWTTDSRRDENGDSPFLIQLHERFTRAELLYELGRHGEALPWYTDFSQDSFGLYTAPAHFRLAQIHEGRGDRRDAIAHYSRFLELWRDSDPALQPLVQQARNALARLNR